MITAPPPRWRALALAILCASGALLAASEQAHAIGLMLPRDTAERPFDVESQRVEVTITNTAAVTHVEQVFRNHTNRPMEAVFVFPIPEGATVSDFSLWIEGKKTPGAVLERQEARQIYESIVRRVEDPGLIEYMDGKLFRASIFPIPPHGTQKLEIKFGQILQKQGGLYRYHYPLAVGKDYVTAKTAKDFTLTARVQAPLPLTTIYSPTHRISTHRKSAHEVTVGTEELYAALDRDFDLYLGMSQADVGLHVMTHDLDGEGGEPGYFMMALAPRVDVAAHDEIGQTFTFVMDTSGSMVGPKMEQARKALAFCVSRLKPQDHFNIVRFSTDVEALHPAPVPASAANRERALTFVRDMVAAGGTAISPALELALSQRLPAQQPHQVIFVTDGIPTVGETDPDAILRWLKGKRDDRTRVFTFGVGFDVNTTLLDGVASQARGRSDYVRPEEDMEAAIGALYTRIASPVLSDLQIDFGQARVYDLYPSPIPDLFRGDQVVLFGRMRAPLRGPIVVRGRAGQEVKSYRFGDSMGESSKQREPVTPTEAHLAPLEFLPKLWATRKVGYLLEQIRLNGEQAELKSEVILLAKKFGLVTPYTSYLAVDDSEFARNPSSRPEPEPLRADRPGLRNERPRPTRGLNGERRPPQAAPSARPADGDAETSLGGLGSGRSMGNSAMPSSAPSKPASVSANKKREAAFKDFAEETGEGAVAASEATRELKQSERVERDKSLTRQYVAGRTFTLTSGVWVEESLDLNTAKPTRVEAFSAPYFELVRKHSALKQILQLGPSVLLKLDGKVYRFEPAPKKK